MFNACSKPVALLYSVSWDVVTREKMTRQMARSTLPRRRVLRGSILNAVGRVERKRSDALSAKH